MRQTYMSPLTGQRGLCGIGSNWMAALSECCRTAKLPRRARSSEVPTGRELRQYYARSALLLESGRSWASCDIVGSVRKPMIPDERICIRFTDPTEGRATRHRSRRRGSCRLTPTPPPRLHRPELTNGGRDRCSTRWRALNENGTDGRGAGTLSPGCPTFVRAALPNEAPPIVATEV